MAKLCVMPYGNGWDRSRWDVGKPPTDAENCTSRTAELIISSLSDRRSQWADPPPAHGACSPNSPQRHRTPCPCCFKGFTVLLCTEWQTQAQHTTDSTAVHWTLACLPGRQSLVLPYTIPTKRAGVRKPSTTKGRRPAHARKHGEGSVKRHGSPSV